MQSNDSSSRSRLTALLLHSCLALFQFIAISRVASAALGQWTTAGPEGGIVEEIAIDPSSPMTIYAGTFQPTANRAVLFKSLDGGENWNSLALNTSSIHYLAIDPNVTSTVYVVADGDCQIESGSLTICLSILPFKSTDSGKTWVQIDSGLTDQVGPFALDPSNSQILYAAGLFGGLFQSNDGGGSWVAMDTSWLPSATSITTLTVDPHASSTLYAGTASETGIGLFRTTDRGQTWVPITAGLAPTAPANARDIDQFSIDPNVSTTIYIATSSYNNQIQGDTGTTTFEGSESFKSTDSGATWTALPAQAGFLFLDPSKPGTLYSPKGNVLFLSQDGGFTWKFSSSAGLAEQILTVAIDPSSNPRFYVSTYGGGIFTTTNLLGSWTPINHDLIATFVLTMAVDPTSSTVYAGTQQSGLFKSIDAGSTWVAMNNGLPSAAVNAIALQPGSPAILYAVTNSGLFKSKDGAQTWKGVGSGLQSQLLAIAIENQTPTTLYIGTVSHGVFKSTDAGVTWTQASSGLGTGPVNALATTVAAPSKLFAATGSGLFVSSDGAATWSSISAAMSPPNPSFYAVALEPSNPSTIFAASTTVLKSTDSGATWSSSPTSPSGGVFALAIAPTAPPVVFAGTYGGGVFESTDEGSSWNTVNSGLFNQVVTALSADNQGTFVHAATFGGGVFDLTLVAPQPCIPNETTLCLHGARFGVRGSFTTPDGQAGNAHVVPLTDESGYFWFFDSSNIEILLKSIDGCALNSRFWLFDAGLTNVETTVSVTDSMTGVRRSYFNSQGVAFAPNQDTSAFDCTGTEAAAVVQERSPSRIPPVFPNEIPLTDSAGTAVPGHCTPNATTLCLSNGRFSVSAVFHVPTGETGNAMAVPLTADTGYFWFFNAADPEEIIKVLNACSINQRFWIFAGGLTNVRVVTTVTDTATGTVNRYVNQQGSLFQPLQDTSTFSVCP